MFREVVERIPSFIILFTKDSIRIYHLVPGFESKDLGWLVECLHLFIKSIKLISQCNFNLFGLHYLFYLEAIKFNFKTYY